MSVKQVHYIISNKHNIMMTYRPMKFLSLIAMNLLQRFINVLSVVAMTVYCCVKNNIRIRITCN